MNFFANVLTCLSLFGGFLSIVFSLEQHYTFSAWAIIVAVVFDGLDGQVARRNPQPSEFGKELDSLADVITFGIAPSILGYTFVFHKVYLADIFGLFFYLICSVMRLAKYNITTQEKSNFFHGLPTTMSGGFLASYILVYRRYTGDPPSFLFLLLAIGLAVLMVSRVRYPNIDGIWLRFGGWKMPSLILLSTALAATAVFRLAAGVFLPEVGIFTLFALYVFFSPHLSKDL